jgi:hypothetical protein
MANIAATYTHIPRGIFLLFMRIYIYSGPKLNAYLFQKYHTRTMSGQIFNSAPMSSIYFLHFINANIIIWHCQPIVFYINLVIWIILQRLFGLLTQLWSNFDGSDLGIGECLYVYFLWCVLTWLNLPRAHTSIILFKKSSHVVYVCAHTLSACAHKTIMFWHQLHNMVRWQWERRCFNYMVGHMEHYAHALHYYYAYSNVNLSFPFTSIIHLHKCILELNEPPALQTHYQSATSFYI